MGSQCRVCRLVSVFNQFYNLITVYESTHFGYKINLKNALFSADWDTLPDDPDQASIAAWWYQEPWVDACRLVILCADFFLFLFMSINNHIFGI